MSRVLDLACPRCRHYTGRDVIAGSVMDLAAERTDGLAAKADTSARARAHTHTHTHTHARTHTHTRTHARTQTHTNAIINKTKQQHPYKNISLSLQRTTDRGKRIDILNDRQNNLGDCLSITCNRIYLNKQTNKNKNAKSENKQKTQIYHEL